MGNQASKIMHKAKERTGDRRSRHPNRSLSVKSTSVASHTERATTSKTDTPHIAIDTDDSVQTSAPNQRPTKSAKTDKTGKVIDQDDFKEIDRSQRQHYVLKSMRKVNHWVSYNCDGIILDIGTGHGDWAYEVASTYPKSKIIGLDLNPPTVPVTIQNNLEFKIQDITQRWDIPDNSVDFLFQRDMNRVLLKSDWKHVLREMYRVAQPGGVLEIVEPDLFHHNAGPVQTAADEYFKDQCEKIGRDWSLADHLSEDLTNIGFINVEKKSLDIPVGEWPSDPNLKQIGFNNFELQRSKLRAMRANYVNVVGLSAEEYDAASKQILSEYEDYQGYTIWVCWTAQKPA